MYSSGEAADLLEDNMARKQSAPAPKRANADAVDPRHRWDRPQQAPEGSIPTFETQPFAA